MESGRKSSFLQNILSKTPWWRSHRPQQGNHEIWNFVFRNDFWSNLTGPRSLELVKNGNCQKMLILTESTLQNTLMMKPPSPTRKSRNMKFCIQICFLIKFDRYAVIRIGKKWKVSERAHSFRISSLKCPDRETTVPYEKITNFDFLYPD